MAEETEKRKSGESVTDSYSETPRIFLKDICPKLIYFIGSREHGIVKIGVSICPNRRAQEISLVRGIPMEVLGTEPGGYAEERQFHERFAKYALGNEYFTLSPEIDEYASGLIDMISRYYAQRATSLPLPIQEAR